MAIRTIEELLLGCRQQDRTAQRALYDQFCDFVFRACYKYAVDVPEAQDMVQNTFVRVFTHIHEYDPAKGTFVNWLHRIAVREAIAVKRKNARLQFDESALAQLNPVVAGDIFEKMTLDEIKVSILKLPENHRTILMLHYFDGFAHDEIAELLQIEVSSSRARLSRARSELLHEWQHLKFAGL